MAQGVRYGWAKLKSVQCLTCFGCEQYGARKVGNPYILQDSLSSPIWDRLIQKCFGAIQTKGPILKTEPEIKETLHQMAYTMTYSFTLLSFFLEEYTLKKPPLRWTIWNQKPKFEVDQIGRAHVWTPVT